MTEKKIDKILVEIKSLRNDMNTKFEQVDKRFEQVDKRFEQVNKQMAENYKIAQRANVLVEDLKSRVEQIAEGTVEARIFGKKIEDHDERISQLEWRSDMHEKAIKKA